MDNAYHKAQEARALDRLRADIDRAEGPSDRSLRRSNEIEAAERVMQDLAGRVFDALGASRGDPAAYQDAIDRLKPAFDAVRALLFTDRHGAAGPLALAVSGWRCPDCARTALLVAADWNEDRDSLDCGRCRTPMHKVNVAENIIGQRLFAALEACRTAEDLGPVGGGA